MQVELAPLTNANNPKARADVIEERGSRHLALMLMVLTLAFGCFAVWWLGFTRERPHRVFTQQHSTYKKLYGRPIKVGILHSRKGAMAAAEGNVLRATLQAIQELNQQGGVLGRRVQPIFADGASLPHHFGSAAEHLITKEKVVALFGCWRSAGRKAVLPILQRHQHVLFYPASYEGLEQSPYVIYLGATAHQRISVLVKWALGTHKHRHFFFVGSEGPHARITREVLSDALTKAGGKLVGTHSIPIGSIDVEASVQAIMYKRPHVIVNALRGVSNLAFFSTLRQMGITSRLVPTISLHLAEPELKTMDIGHLVGDYAIWSYFRQLRTNDNLSFLLRLQREQGIDSVVSASMQAAYAGVKLWAQAVHRARSTHPQGVRELLHTQEINAPEGTLQFKHDQFHTARYMRLGQIQENGQFQLIYSTPTALLPHPYPPSRTRRAWQTLADKIERMMTTKHTPANHRPASRAAPIPPSHR